LHIAVGEPKPVDPHVQLINGNGAQRSVQFCNNDATHAISGTFVVTTTGSTVDPPVAVVVTTDAVVDPFAVDDVDVSEDAAALVVVVPAGPLDVEVITVATVDTVVTDASIANVDVVASVLLVADTAVVVFDVVIVVVVIVVVNGPNTYEHRPATPCAESNITGTGNHDAPLSFEMSAFAIAPMGPFAEPVATHEPLKHEYAMPVGVPENAGTGCHVTLSFVHARELLLPGLLQPRMTTPLPHASVRAPQYE